jgi:hypothetical protein
LPSRPLFGGSQRVRVPQEHPLPVHDGPGVDDAVEGVVSRPKIYAGAAERNRASRRTQTVVFNVVGFPTYVAEDDSAMKLDED